MFKIHAQNAAGTASTEGIAIPASRGYEGSPLDFQDIMAYEHAARPLNLGRLDAHATLAIAEQRSTRGTISGSSVTAEEGYGIQRAIHDYSRNQPKTSVKTYKYAQKVGDMAMKTRPYA